MLLAGCAQKQTIPVTVSDPGHLSAKDARAVVEAAIRQRHDVQAVQFIPAEIVVVMKTATARIQLNGQITQYQCSSLDGCDVWVRAIWTNPSSHDVGAASSAWLFSTPGGDPQKIRPVVDAFNELVARNLYADRLDGDFSSKAASWRAANPKPPLSETGNKHRILAENAFREKNVELAIEHFEAALESDPTWPDGTFNLAVLYGETGDYRQAARFMKRYLLLVPDSKDAKAAREKIVIWEDKATRATP